MSENLSQMTEYLNARRSGIQRLWQSHADQMVDWNKYFIKYRFEGLRGLIALAIAVMGVSRFSTSTTTDTSYESGSILLIGFVVFAIALDLWRSKTIFWSQQEESKFVNSKIGEIQSFIIAEQTKMMQSGKMPEEKEIEKINEYINTGLITAFDKRQKSPWEKSSNIGQDVLEVILILTFFVAVIIYFL